MFSVIAFFKILCCNRNPDALSTQSTSATAQAKGPVGAAWCSIWVPAPGLLADQLRQERPLPHHLSGFCEM